jgi:hypothetical protein
MRRLNCGRLYVAQGIQRDARLLSHRLPRCGAGLPAPAPARGLGTAQSRWDMYIKDGDVKHT